MEFNLQKHASKIAYVNFREEKHGEESVLAVDVKITTDVPNDFLSYLSPGLKAAVYEKELGQRDLIADDNHLSHLRFPDLGTLAWSGTMVRAAVVIHGVKKSQDLELVADVTKLKLDPKEGGTVSITFTVQLCPNESQAAHLPIWLGKEAKVSVGPNTEEIPPAGENA